MCSIMSREGPRPRSLAPSLAPRFLPSRLGRDFETGSPRPTSPAQVCARRSPGAGCTRKGISLPPLVTRMRRGNHHPFPHSLPPSPSTFTPFSQRLGFAMQQRAQLAGWRGVTRWGISPGLLPRSGPRRRLEAVHCYQVSIGLQLVPREMNLTKRQRRIEYSTRMAMTP